MNHPEVAAIRESLIELINHGTAALTTGDVMRTFRLSQQRANLLRRHKWEAFSLDALLDIAQRVNPLVKLRLEVE